MRFLSPFGSGLETWHRDFTEEEVLISLDETSKLQTKETRQPNPGRLYLPGPALRGVPVGGSRRIAERPEIHFTPKHGRWLNLAEIESSLLGRQCLDRRISDREALLNAVGAWQVGRNRAGVGATWRFKTADARTRLKSLYPSIQ